MVKERGYSETFCNELFVKCSFFQDCDANFLEKRHSQGGTKRQVLKRTAGAAEKTELSSQTMCTNNFLRRHDTSDDELLMEERPTELKGFGVFAKCDISEVRHKAF